MFLEAEDLEAMRKNKTFSFRPCQSGCNALLFTGSGLARSSQKRAEDLRRASQVSVSVAVKTGVQIALGTDAGGGAARHGRIAREAELMVECGMRTSDALIAATSSAARLIGESERGTIELGKIADLVLLDANPLEDIGALRLVAASFKLDDM